MKSVYVKTVGELVDYLQTLPRGLVVSGADEDSDGLNVTPFNDYNFVMFKGVW